MPRQNSAYSTLIKYGTALDKRRTICVSVNHVDRHRHKLIPPGTFEAPFIVLENTDENGARLVANWLRAPSRRKEGFIAVSETMRLASIDGHLLQLLGASGADVTHYVAETRERVDLGAAAWAKARGHVLAAMAHREQARQEEEAAAAAAAKAEERLTQRAVELEAAAAATAAAVAAGEGGRGGRGGGRRGGGSRASGRGGRSGSRGGRGGRGSSSGSSES